MKENYNHPVFTRYPHLKEKSIAGDYIYSEDNLRTTEWKRTFVFTPKVTISGKKVWLKTILKTNRWIQIEPPQFPKVSYSKNEVTE